MPRVLIGPGAFRFLLAFLVVIEHVSRFQIGKVAVMIFFMLSGYWVTKVYRERYTHQPQGTAIFYLARFLRIWPLFALVAGLSVLAMALVGRDIGLETLFALPILGVASHGVDPVGVTWSLDIELQFYLLLPLLLILFANLSTPLGRATATGGVIVLWGVGMALSKMLGIETVLHFLPMFVIGMLIYLGDWQVSGRIAWASVAMFVAFSLWAMLVPEFRSYLFYGSGDTFGDFSFAMIWAIFLVPFVVYNLHQKSNRMDHHLGQLSYTLYLVHFPVILVMRELGEGSQGDLGRLANVGMSLGLAVLLYVAVDQVINAQRQRIMQRLTLPRRNRDQGLTFPVRRVLRVLRDQQRR